MTDRTYIPRAEAPAYFARRGLKITKSYLAKLAVCGGSPEYQTFGGRAYYTKEALDIWIEQRLSAPRCSTSEIL